jgi:hypothetical protein
MTPQPFIDAEQQLELLRLTKRPNPHEPRECLVEPFSHHP